MRAREYRIGPGAVSLMLVVVVVSMSVLGLLALISSKGDCALTERTMMFVTSEYSASARAEEMLAQLDEVLMKAAVNAVDEKSYLEAISEKLPEKMTLTDRRISWNESSDGGRTLICEVEILPMNEEERFERKKFMFMAAESFDLFE